MNPALDEPQAVPETFVPTPERLASFSFLELKQEEAHDLLMSAKGRKELLSRILPHVTDIQTLHPDFNPESLPRQLEEISGLLATHEKFLTAANSTEKKSLFQRALQTIKEFPKNHPFITAVLAVAAVTGGVALSAYLAGGMEALLAKVGLSHLYGAAGAAKASEELGKKIIERAGNLYDGSTAGEML